MRGRSPDQFGLSRLKEGERVCGGRGQFGKQPLWGLNMISKFRMEGGSTEECKCDSLGKCFHDRRGCIGTR